MFSSNPRDLPGLVWAAHPPETEPPRSAANSREASRKWIPPSAFPPKSQTDAHLQTPQPDLPPPVGLRLCLSHLRFLAQTTRTPAKLHAELQSPDALSLVRHKSPTASPAAHAHAPPHLSAAAAIEPPPPVFHPYRWPRSASPVPPEQPPE